MTANEALTELMAEFGYDNVTDLLINECNDSIVPAICISCGAIDEMEPDQDQGYCEECGKNKVKSALILAGII